MRIILNSAGTGDDAAVPRVQAVLAHIAVVLLVAACGIALGACSMRPSAAETNGRVHVVAAENFWGNLASQIAGPDADVASVISNPDTDPHDYEPTPANARAIANARLVIVNGIGYDPWARQLLAADDASGRVLLDVGHLLRVPAGGNPHQWYSYAAVQRVIDRIAHDLSTVDPQHRIGYAARGRSLSR